MRPIKVETEYPYNKVIISDNENVLFTALTSLIIDNAENNSLNVPELDYEVLYIGQSYDEKGKRNVIDRLNSHSTLQKFYANSMSEFPNSDIWIMLADFKQLDMTVFASYDLINVTNENRKIENKKFNNLTENNGLVISIQQRINFTEAALIKYSESQYNKTYKNSFPKENHKSYSECYNLDIRAINVEIDTSEIGICIYNEKSERKTYHSYNYEFKTQSDRFKLLNFNENNE